jgi:hypothetical protein
MTVRSEATDPHPDPRCEVLSEATPDPHDFSARLSALSSRLRTAADDCDTSADSLIATAASQRQRATLLRREADRAEELWKRLT